MHPLFLSKNCLLSLCVSLISLMAASTLIIYDDINITIIPQSTYQIVIVALFFIDAIAAIFMFTQYICNKKHYDILLLGFAFLSGLLYFAETIAVIQKPLETCTTIESKSNDIAIFYLFRQLSFLFLLLLSLFIHTPGHKTNKNRKLLLLLLSLFPLLIFPILSHNLSSYNPEMAITITYYHTGSKSQMWVMGYVYLLLALWALCLLLIIYRTKLHDDMWRSITVLCLSGFCCNLLLIALLRYDLSIWYICRMLEAISKMCIITTLMYSIFHTLNNISEKAFHDPLTAIYNRRFFFTEFDRFLQEWNFTPYCAMIVDIDRFKRINDRYGHEVGDKTLIAVARIIADTLRNEDLFARIGGEEFGILSQNINNREMAKNIAEKIRINIERNTSIDGYYNLPESMTVCIGVYFSTPIKHTSSEAMRLADIALYQAKNSGRNKVIVYEPSFDAPPPARGEEH
ncbi:sensor domain-containing diguanylate cyclase [[Enterobacter] lignolyticus]|uniref:diguanylate cyclase n=1 Tax=Enterobacter lignolyticus (strain SCF1) TaxID=701347 RepID=E3GD31_ENTLS|nr:GGDEF domain-containing protein [[Enterobacter] lignolyticus]ADO49050.1 diguanylate cyclase [[Enterobacter] lignolyticus SCF1]